MSKRSDPWRSRGVVMIAIWLVGGCVALGVGIVNVRNAQQIREHGVTVNATVIQNHGYGPYSVRIRYVTAAGQQEQGTLDTPDQSPSYPVGSEITVVYDPYSPSTVTLPGSGSSGGWTEIGMGIFALLLLATAVGWGRLRSRQHVRLSQRNGSATRTPP